MVTFGLKAISLHEHPMDNTHEIHHAPCATIRLVLGGPSTLFSSADLERIISSDIRVFADNFRTSRFDFRESTFVAQKWMQTLPPEPTMFLAREM